MRTRIKELRKILKLTQDEFAKKIGLSQNSYSAIETGRNSLTDQNIKLICFAFGINESWLKTGTGAMFVSENLSDEMEILQIFRELSPDVQNLFLDYGHVLLKNEKALKSAHKTSAVIPLQANAPTDASARRV
jgi:transcriptional regulator with XRE-family HTH domain